jgi:sortase A
MAFNKYERCLLAVGICLMSIDAAALLHRAVASRLALREFDQVRAAAPPEQAGSGGPDQADFRGWAPSREKAYRESLSKSNGSAMAVLRVARVNLRVPVFEGTDEWVLNRGVGWIRGTAKPGQPGNVGIAGHRDGFFRQLKDVQVGDTLELSTTETTEVYIVDQIKIVQPQDVSVLQPRPVRSLTLVTCYPFYYLGDAPKRYVLQAGLKESGRYRQVQ